MMGSSGSGLDQLSWPIGHASYSIPSGNSFTKIPFNVPDLDSLWTNGGIARSYGPNQYWWLSGGTSGSGTPSFTPTNNNGIFMDYISTRLNDEVAQQYGLWEMSSSVLLYMGSPTGVPAPSGQVQIAIVRNDWSNNTASFSPGTPIVVKSSWYDWTGTYSETYGPYMSVSIDAILKTNWNENSTGVYTAYPKPSLGTFLSGMTYSIVIQQNTGVTISAHSFNTNYANASGQISNQGRGTWWKGHLISYVSS